MPYTTEAERWRALTIRDQNADKHFIYGVKSTFCYCRPTCPARLARRANVVFFKTGAQAEAAGFRACKRCKPDLEAHEEPADKAVAKACTLIEEGLMKNDEKALRLQDLAKGVGLTPRYFHKIFKDKTGMTPAEYVKSRMGKGPGVDGTCTARGDGVEVATIGFDGFNDFNLDDLLNFDLEASITPEEVPTPRLPDIPTPTLPDWAPTIQEMNLLTQLAISYQGPAQIPCSELDKPTFLPGMSIPQSIAPVASLQAFDTPIPTISNTESDDALVFGVDDSTMLASSAGLNDEAMINSTLGFQDFIYD
jgi:methylphosphotriester-DNA--protein-cysteine methyltransferase